MKPSLSEISHVLTETVDRLEIEGIRCLLRNKTAADFVTGIVINENYTDDALNLAEECGLPIKGARLPELGITILEAEF